MYMYIKSSLSPKRVLMLYAPELDFLLSNSSMEHLSSKDSTLKQATMASQFPLHG